VRVSTIPEITDVTPTWLTRALGAAGLDGVRIERVQMERIGTGQAAACARLSIEYAAAPPGAPQTLIAKFASDDEASRRNCAAMGIYRREVEFYRDIAPRLHMSLPRCWYLDVDAPGERFLILMEDLAPATPGDQLVGCAPEVVRAAIMELVGLQAPTWCDTALGSRFMEPADGFFSDMHGLYNRMLPGFVKRYGKALAPDELAIIKEVGAARCAPLFQPVGTPFCLEHRDYRPDNLMIDTTGAVPRVVAVDWQGMRTGRPLNDVALCLAGSLEPDARRAVEHDILRDYHRALVGAGVCGFDYEQCWTEYRRAAFAGFGLTVVAAMAVVQTPRGDRMFEAMARRYARHALDVDARAFLRSADNDPTNS
jgi:hypothetical protein